MPTPSSLSEKFISKWNLFSCPEVQLSESEPTTYTHLLGALDARLKSYTQFKKQPPLHLHLQLSPQILGSLQTYLSQKEVHLGVFNKITLHADWESITWKQLESLLLQLSALKPKIKQIYLEGNHFSEEFCIALIEFIKAQPVALEIIFPAPYRSCKHQKELDTLVWSKPYHASKDTPETVSIAQNTDTNSPSAFLIPERRKAKKNINISHGVQLQNQRDTSISYTEDVAIKNYSFNPKGNAIPLSKEALYQKWESQQLNLPESAYLNKLTDETWENCLGHIPDYFENTITHLTQRAFEQLIQFQKQFQFGLNFGQYLPPGFFVIQKGEYANCALDYARGKAFIDTVQSNPITVQYYTPDHYLLSPNTINQWKKSTENNTSLTQAEIFAKTLLELKPVDHYDRESLLLFREILLTLLALSDSTIAQLKCLVALENKSSAISKCAFLLKYWPELHGYTSKETLPKVAQSLLSSHYGEANLDTILKFAQNVQKDMQRLVPESSFLYQQLDSESLKAIQTFFETKKHTHFTLSFQTLNALLSVYEYKGPEGVKTLIQLWKSLDQIGAVQKENKQDKTTLLTLLNSCFFSKMPSYLPLLTTEYLSAFKAIQSFYQDANKALWWETLFMAHSQAVGADYLPHLSATMQAFFNKVEQLNLSISPLNKEHSLSKTKSLPVTVARILTLLNQCKETDRKTQWDAIPNVDLSSQGAILTTSNKMQPHYQFALPEMHLSATDWKLQTTLSSEEIREELIKKALLSLEGEALLEVHYRLIAAENCRLSAGFYKKNTQAVIEQNFNPAVTRVLLFLLRATTLGEHLEPALADNNEEVLCKEFDNFIQQASNFNVLCTEILKEKTLGGLVEHVLETCAYFEICNAGAPLCFSTALSLEPTAIFLFINNDNPNSNSWKNILKNAVVGGGFSNAIMNSPTMLKPLITGVLKLNKNLPENILMHSNDFRSAAIGCGKMLYEGIRFTHARINDNNASYKPYLDHFKLIEAINDDFSKKELDPNIKPFIKSFIALISTFNLKQKDFDSIYSTFTRFQEKKGRDKIPPDLYPLLMQTTDYLRQFSSNQIYDYATQKDRPLDLANLLEFLDELYEYLWALLPNKSTINLKAEILKYITSKFPNNLPNEVSRRLQRDLAPKEIQDAIKNAFENAEECTEIANCLSHFFDDVDEYQKALTHFNNIKTRLKDPVLFQSFLKRLSHNRLYQTEHGFSPNLHFFNQLLNTLSNHNTLSALFCLIEHTVSLGESYLTQYHGWLEKACVYQLWIVDKFDTGLKALYSEECLNLLSQTVLALSGESIQANNKAHLDKDILKFINTLDTLLDQYPITKPLMLGLWKYYLEQYPIETGEPLSLDALKEAIDVFSLAIQSLNHEQDVLVLIAAFQPPNKNKPLCASDRSPFVLFDLLKSMRTVVINKSRECTNENELSLASTIPEEILEKNETKNSTSFLSNISSWFTGKFKQTEETEKTTSSIPSPPNSSIKPLFKATEETKLNNNTQTITETDDTELKILLPILLRTLPCGESLAPFNQLQADYKDQKISEASLNHYYSLPPYPSISQVLSWQELPKEEANEAHRAFMLNPKKRNAMNGFKLNFAQKQAKNFKDATFSQANLQALSQHCKAVKRKTPQVLLDELKQIQAQPSNDSDPTRLIATLAEWLYRSNSFEQAYEINTTQYLALLTILKQYSSNADSSILLQMSTGEGKSRVTVLACACLYLLGYTPIEVITSDLDLARRDLNEYRWFFESLNIPTSLISATSPEGAYQQKGINFSTAANLSLFINARLLDSEFPPKQSPKVAIIDEIDNTLNLYNIAFNNSQPSQLWEGMEWIYSEAISFLDIPQGKRWRNQPDTDWAETYSAFLHWILQRRQSDTINEAFLNQKRNALAQVLEAARSAYSLQYKTQFIIKQKVPLPTQKGIQYSSVPVVVQNNRTEENSHYSDGVDPCLRALLEMWRKKVKTLTTKPDDLPQGLFEQLKKCEYPFIIEPEAENFASTTIKKCLDRYTNIVGLTGTAGNPREREEFKKLYGLSTIEVPPHRPSKRVDNPPRLCSDRNSQINALIEYIQIAQAKKQAVLIISKDDNDSQEFMDEIIHRCKNNPKISPKLFQRLEASTDSTSAEAMIRAAGHAGAVTFGTSRISRGTHVSLSEEIKQIGGLLLETHVGGIRDGDQAKGRVNRNGEPGETRYVLNCKELPPDTLSKLFLNPEKYLKERQIKIDDNAQAERLCTEAANELFHWACQTKLNEKSEWESAEWNQFYQPLSEKFHASNLKAELQAAVSLEEQTQVLKSYLPNFGLENNQEAYFKIQQPLQTLADLQKISIKFTGQKQKIFDRWDNALAGRATVFNGLFKETLASLEGEREWFLNTKRWFKGEGIICADWQAVWHGEREIFANTRLAVGGWIASIKSTTIVVKFTQFIHTIRSTIHDAFFKLSPRNTSSDAANDEENNLLNSNRKTA